MASPLATFDAVYEQHVEAVNEQLTRHSLLDKSVQKSACRCTIVLLSNGQCTVALCQEHIQQSQLEAVFLTVDVSACGDGNSEPGRFFLSRVLPALPGFIRKCHDLLM